MNKYKIGDEVEFTYGGETRSGRIYRIEIPTKRIPGTSKRPGYSIIPEGSIVGYRVTNCPGKLIEKEITKTI